MDKCSRTTSLPPASKVSLLGSELKWVPKVNLAVVDIEIPISPSVDFVSKAVDSDSADEIIYWEPEEVAWVHTAMEMRYDPQLHSYHMFLGGYDESGRLIYHVEGGCLALTTSGIDGASNW